MSSKLPKKRSDKSSTSHKSRSNDSPSSPALETTVDTEFDCDSDVEVVSPNANGEVDQDSSDGTDSSMNRIELRAELVAQMQSLNIDFEPQPSSSPKSHRRHHNLPQETLNTSPISSSSPTVNDELEMDGITADESQSKPKRKRERRMTERSYRGGELTEQAQTTKRRRRTLSNRRRPILSSREGSPAAHVEIAEAAAEMMNLD